MLLLFKFHFRALFDLRRRAVVIEIITAPPCLFQCQAAFVRDFTGRTKILPIGATSLERAIHDTSPGVDWALALVQLLD